MIFKYIYKFKYVVIFVSFVYLNKYVILMEYFNFLVILGIGRRWMVVLLLYK